MKISPFLQACASAPELSVIRLQTLLRLQPWSFGLLGGLIVFCGIMLQVPLLNLDRGDAIEILGNALFFGVSIGILLGSASPVLRGGARDLDALRSVLPIPDASYQCLQTGMTRVPRSASMVLLAIGLLLGLAHNVLLNHHRLAMPFVLIQMGMTLLLWVSMLTIVPKLVQNALLFSRLGALAQPDLLRPSRHAAFGSAALRPALFLVGIVCAYGFLIIGDDDPFDDGVWIGLFFSFLTLIGIVVLPLRGIRRRIRETRGQVLAELDRRFDEFHATRMSEAEAHDLAAMDTILDMRERVAQAPGWPVDFAGIKRILLYVVLPPLTWAAAALTEILISGAL